MNLDLSSRYVALLGVEPFVRASGKEASPVFHVDTACEPRDQNTQEIANDQVQHVRIGFWGVRVYDCRKHVKGVSLVAKLQKLSFAAAQAP